MDTDLKNKVILVAGGADGIGYGICDKYLEEGAKTAIIVDINQEQGNKAVTALTAKHGDKVQFIPGDVTTDLDRIFEVIVSTYKAVDVLVLAAAIVDDTKTKKMIDVMLTSAIMWSFKFKEIMRNDVDNGKGGTIILISSIYGFRVTPFYSVYQAAKYGVNGFATSMGHLRNFEKTGVRVLALCPGFTETKLTQSVRDLNFLETLEKDHVAYLDKHVWQDVDAVSNAAVEVFKIAVSGSVWVIEGGKLTERKSEDEN